MDETLIIRRNELKKKLLPLEWDKKLNEIHFAREIEMKAYRHELEVVEKEIEGGQNAEVL